MSAENVKKGIVHPNVPIYDAVVFADLKCEPAWVYEQVDFIAAVCEEHGIPFYILDSMIFDDQASRVKNGRYVKIPFWTMSNGKRGMLRRACTADYKVRIILQFVKYNILGYRKYQKIKSEDCGLHEMHIGFSAEEHKRASESRHPLFINRFPLVEMGLERCDTYRYILEEWGLKTKASACYICPFHKNYFFNHLREHSPNDYDAVLRFDKILSEKSDDGAVKSELYISYSCKRICDLTAQDCDDGEFFNYRGESVWNGF